MQKAGCFTKIKFCSILLKVNAWLSNHTLCKIGLKCSNRALGGVGGGEAEEEESEGEKGREELKA
jgi:hypothetical protein